MQEIFQQLNKSLLSLIANLQKKKLKNLNQYMYPTSILRIITINLISFVLLLWSPKIYAQIAKSDQTFTKAASGTLDDVVHSSDSTSPHIDIDMKVDVSVIDNYAILENSIFKIKYSQKAFPDSVTNNVITKLLIKSASNENQANEGQIDGVWMGYGIGRGALSKGSFVKYNGDDKKILHLEWGNGKVIQELTIYPDNPVIKIDYIRYGINIVDVGSPGGSTGMYTFCGGVKWQQLRQTIKNKALVNNPNKHHRLTNDLYPAYPNPIIDTPDWEGLEPAPLTYKGCLIMGLYNSENGRGFGRVMPAVSINYLKLLGNRGFEGFPYWIGEKGKGGGIHPAFTGYLFVVSGGANEIINLGKSIADGTFLSKKIGRGKLSGRSVDELDTIPPGIDLWYGNQQRFGQIGVPQQWVNILGNVNDKSGVASLTYSLNGGIARPLTIGPDGLRLQSAGDFNIEINREDLISGSNQIIIKAVDFTGNIKSVSMTVLYSGNNIWPETYAINWSDVNNIQDVAQIVDGKWTKEGNSIHTAITGYDRLVAIGDSTWDDYEITAAIIINSPLNPSVSHGNFVGFAMRCRGHYDWDGKQPRWGWWPMGAIGGYSKVGSNDYRLQIQGNNALIIADDTSGKHLTVGVPYIFKMRAQTVGTKTVYSLKVWEQGTIEPSEWTISGFGVKGELKHGSVLLLIHNADVSIGNVTIKPGPFSDNFNTPTKIFMNKIGNNLTNVPAYSTYSQT